MKILKILGIAAGLHALALILIFANPGCSATKAAGADPSPISSAPAADAPAAPATITAPSDATIRYSPTRPGTTVASALEAQPISDVTPATTYTVVRGDNLSTVAKKNQITKADLSAANNLTSGSVLHVGQKLIIPSKSPKAMASEPIGAPATTAAAGEAAPEKAPGDVVRHVVKSGETLGGIARRYGVKQGDIAVANNITDPRKIQPGQELIIPEKSSTAAKGAKATKAPDAAAAPSASQDLDAGLKPASTTDVPVIKVEDTSAGQQPKNP